jgi:hypothetical protein
MPVGDDLSGLDVEALAHLRARAEFEIAHGSLAARAELRRIESELRRRREREIRRRRGMNDGAWS